MSNFMVEKCFAELLCASFCLYFFGIWNQCKNRSWNVGEIDYRGYFFKCSTSNFLSTDPESTKKTVKLSFFALLGSVRAKAAHKMLAKLIPGCIYYGLSEVWQEAEINFKQFHNVNNFCCWRHIVLRLKNRGKRGENIFSLYLIVFNPT